MTFLNPLYLIALAAAAIPIILHLLNLRKSRIIEFSTLSFLKELQRSKIRRLKIRQWLLLVLRTLLIVFVVLAFTRPALRGSFDFLPGSQAKSSVVIILDDSFSMLGADDGGQLFKQAKDKAGSVLDLLRPGDEASLILLSAAGKETHQFTSAINGLRGELERAQPSFKHVSLLDGLTAASALLKRTNNINKEIYILTDEQKSHYTTATGGSGTQILFDHSVRVFLFSLGSQRAENTAVVDVHIESALMQKERPVEISATVLNDEASPLRGSVVSVFLDGERVQQKSVDIEAGNVQRVSFTVTPKHSGFLSGFVELEEDRIPEDNRRYFSFYVPDVIRVALGPSGNQEATILSLAMQPSGTTGSGASPVEITQFDRAAIAAMNPSTFDVVVLLGARHISPAFVQRLRASIEAGGSALVMPDAEDESEAFSTVLLRGLGFPNPAGRNGSPGNAGKFTSFSAIDFDHPLFRGMFASRDKENKPVVESPHLYAAVRLRASETAQQVIGTSAGDAFLLDQKLGLGRVLALAVAPNLQWSDFPMKGLFVPLINRSIYYLAAKDEYSFDGIIGKAFDLVVREPHHTGVFDLFAPSGKASRVTPKALSSGSSFLFDDLEEAGVYSLSSSGAPVRTISMNIDQAESRMEKVDGKERDAFYSSTGLARPNMLSRGSNITKTVAEARFGVELWKFMIVLAIVCAIAEMLLARERKRAPEAAGGHTA